MRIPIMIYLDNNATTKPLPEVVEEMLPFLTSQYANPSSIHQFGQAVRHRVEQAREQVASMLGSHPREVYFTSGGTESINLAIRGVLRAQPDKRRIVTTRVEHSAVLRVAEALEDEGMDVQYVGVDGEGRINETEWEAKITTGVAIASIMLANNETGVLFDMERLGAVARNRGVILHVDAVQGAGKVPINVRDLPVDLLSVSAHKFHGPKGTGVLFVRRSTRLLPMILGGTQERNLRGGTEHVAGIVGMGCAAEAAAVELPTMGPKIAHLRDRLEQGILERIPGTRINGRQAPRIGNTTNVSFEGLQAEAMLLLLSEAGYCVSSGAACSSGSLAPSHVLQAMGLEDRFAHGAVRFSLSRFNTDQEIDELLRVLPDLVRRLGAVRGG